MKIEKAERRSHYYNEDRIALGKNYCMVMDGATPLVKIGIKPTEAVWLVSFIKSRLKPTEQNLIKKLAEISVEAYGEMAKFAPCGEESLASCGLAFAEFDGNFVTLSTTGDCEIVVRYKDGKVERQIIPNLPALDGEALAEIVKIARERGITVKEAVKAGHEVLVKNRRLLNKPQGYPVFTPSPKPDFTYLTRRICTDGVEEIYLYSDGITQAFDELKLYESWQSLFSRSVDIKGLIGEIVKRAESDKTLDKYPRFKINDDISIIKITL